ncbi:hypothetical protein QVD17_14699 [Tagetes erecta]|uniref:Mitochondrial import inner membrane translocase subunit TIM50 n=1 Tax=Tagetes erecta TaxID=13708 RepID=A0AAD8NYW3_TARER|nr:hypothetical protein QVD17_14699 [Tagetes erecta]
MKPDESVARSHKASVTMSSSKTNNKVWKIKTPSDHRQKHNETKVWKIKTPIVASNHHQKQAVSSDHRRTTSQHNQKEAGIITPVTNSGDIEEQKDEKQTLISLDRLNIVPKKKLLVIPLRGILVHRAHRSWPETMPKDRRPDFWSGNFLVYKRPYCLEFLKFCFEKFHVGLWSSTRERNLEGILTNLMGDLKNKLLFTWDQAHCTDSGFMCLENKDKPLFLKELNHLWEKKYPNLPWCDGEYSASNTLLVTYPEKAILNPPNTAIFPLNYDPENKKDDFLGPKGELRVFLEGLADAEDVQTYVQDHPIGESEIMPSHPDWEYYCATSHITPNTRLDEYTKVESKQAESGKLGCPFRLSVAPRAFTHLE